MAGRNWARGAILTSALLLAHLVHMAAQDIGAQGAGAGRAVRASDGDASSRNAAGRPRDWPRLQLPDPVARLTARRALDQAWELLGTADCREVLGDFTDRAGRSLIERLRDLSLDPQAYLTRIAFIDGSRESTCVTGVLAFAVPGRPVVSVCVEELKRTWLQSQAHTVAAFIHEMLHTLGLGENPPASHDITARVRARCRAK